MRRNPPDSSLRRLRWLTRILRVLCLLGIGVWGLNLVVSIHDFWIRHSGALYTNPKANLWAPGLAAVASPQVWRLVTWLGLGLFLLWVYQVTTLLQRRSSEPLEFTPGWAAAWFVIPIANLYMSYRVLRELWLASYEEASVGPMLVRLWWGAWMLCMMVGIPLSRGLRGSKFLTALWLLRPALAMAMMICLLDIVTRIGAAAAQERQAITE